MGALTMDEFVDANNEILPKVLKEFEENPSGSYGMEYSVLSYTYFKRRKQNEIPKETGGD